MVGVSTGLLIAWVIFQIKSYLKDHHVSERNITDFNRGVKRFLKVKNDAKYYNNSNSLIKL